MDYRVDSRSYLSRASALLIKDDAASLFYAAFELRCAIEARMAEYLDAHKHISEKKKQGWSIAQLSKNIESAFKLGDKGVEITVFDLSTEKTLAILYYTPISSRLKNLGERLGNFMHVAGHNCYLGDIWWKSFRTQLEKTKEEMEKALIGTLLGPPLLSPDNRIELVEGCNPENSTIKVSPGTTIGIKVQRFDALTFTKK